MGDRGEDKQEEEERRKLKKDGRNPSQGRD